MNNHTLPFDVPVLQKLDAMLRNELRRAAARCVVLMTEHEWPQNWPELFDLGFSLLPSRSSLKLFIIASVSATHAQIPFITLQLLVENVVTLVTVENISRKKDLNNAIASNITYTSYYSSCVDYYSNINQLELNKFYLCDFFLVSDESYSLVRSALDLFSELVEWLPANVLDPYINDLLYTVCSFLETPQHCIYEVVAKCLWRIASRKQAKNEENLVVFALFGDVPMRSIL
uniref:Xpo1 domain-containing protein n=1 Tax=Wuchereria bancrofti TaxID=6293 RepID=A0A1I8EB23_WUCBA